MGARQTYLVVRVPHCDGVHLVSVLVVTAEKPSEQDVRVVVIVGLEGQGGALGPVLIFGADARHEVAIGVLIEVLGSHEIQHFVELLLVPLGVEQDCWSCGGCAAGNPVYEGVLMLVLNAK